jgi:hypothetical protein
VEGVMAFDVGFQILCLEGFKANRALEVWKGLINSFCGGLLDDGPLEYYKILAHIAIGLNFKICLYDKMGVV